MDASQLLASPFTTPTPTTFLPAAVALADPTARCETTISVGGVLSFGPGIPVTTLTHAAVLEIPCAPGQTLEPDATPFVPLADERTNLAETESPEAMHDRIYSSFRDPFLQSLFPVFYVLAATTVTAYMLVIMLFITPRSFLDGGMVYLGRRGFTGGASGGIRIGGRPWLQKVAALTVAISLTIATAETFNEAEEQYHMGAHNANVLTERVMDSTSLKVIRLVSDTFLWLAQAQTLIRLFPRQREKVIIKWTAFALITLQVIFSALNSFHFVGSNGVTRPASFSHAVPAMSYLFHLSLGFLYAAWVIYYSLMKKRYAFYHPLMKNMVLVSTLSLLAILLPVVFFIVDIARPQFIRWGDYVRWVGAAAASVIVWEWVERIEALEREEKKDGVLGREVFDGDEMMEASSSDFPRLRKRRNGRPGPGGSAAAGGSNEAGGSGSGNAGAAVTSSGPGRSAAARLMVWPGLTSIPSRYQGNFQQEQLQMQQQQQQQQGEARNQPLENGGTDGAATRPPAGPTRPAPALTPMSRTDTASAASTDYAIRYQIMSESTGRESETHGRRLTPTSEDAETTRRGQEAPESAPSVVAPVPMQVNNVARADDLEAQAEGGQGRSSRWRLLTPGPLFRRSGSEQAGGPAAAPAPAPAPQRSENTPRRGGYENSSSRWDFRARFEDFAATQAEKIRERMQPTPETDSLPVTVVPAPPRQGVALAQLLEEEGNGARRADGREALERSPSNESGFTHFPGLHAGGGGGADSNLDRTTSGSSSRESPDAGQMTEVRRPPHNPHQPPLWPGVRRFDSDDGAPRLPPSP